MNDEIKNLEMNIMSCLLIKPELMQKLILEDKHFVKHQRLWQFMKAFYKKFNTFDVQLMYSVCKDKWHIINYIILLLDVETTTHNFNLYQKQLLELYEERKKDKFIIENVYKLANELYVRNISVENFKTQIEKIYENAKQISED
jgi:replicative DNA helicase